MEALKLPQEPSGLSQEVMTKDEDDRALLELAAKAAGIALDVTIRTDGLPLFCGERGFAIPEIPGWWNPLADDGAALRLAVKLGLVVCVMNEPGFTGVYLPAEHIGGKYDEVEHHNGDPYAATRRAIVRAAAAMAREA